MKKCTAILLTLLTLLIGVFSALLPTTLQASADTTVYIDVLDDLEKDSTFNLQDYPAIADDYSLQVIQVAESTTGELFVYVYQPSNGVKDFVALSLYMATVPNDHEAFSVSEYDLTLVSKNEVFNKYKVEEFVVDSSSLRYYNIIRLMRAWDIDIDGELAADNTASEFACSVGLTFTASTVNGAVSYAKDKTQVVEILPKDKHVGFIRYGDGVPFSEAGKDSHYIAFYTDTKIENIIEVEIEYVKKNVYKESNTFYTINDLYNEIISDPLTITLIKDQVFKGNSGLFWAAYEYDRIQSKSEFMLNEADYLDSDVLNILSNKQWFLRFLETDYIYRTDATTSADAVIQNYKTIDSYTKIEDVSVFRLKFETDGRTYDLGVVDNKQSGDTSPDGEHTDLDLINQNINKLWEKILQLAGILFVAFIVVKILMSVCGALIGKILSCIWELLKFVIKWAFRIAFFPLWLLFGRRKK